VQQKLNVSCIDLHSPYCPCMLAETNHCIMCSQLRGQSTCDCNWSGLCILYEKHWQPKICSSEQPTVRIEMETNISRKELIANNAYLLEFTVNEALAEELTKTGAFVFLRQPNDPEYFHFPVGVMNITGQLVQVAVEDTGPKTNRLLTSNNDRIFVRGPYYNGILGQPWIDNITCGTIILATGGMGQAPALAIGNKLLANKNDVIVIVAPGKVGEIFIGQKLRELGATVYAVDSLRRSGLGIIERLFESGRNIDLVVSTGPDQQHCSIITTMQNAEVNIPMAATNNATMCCGEGICGSCQRETADNRTLRMCKVQADFTQFAPS